MRGEGGGRGGGGGKPGKIQLGDARVQTAVGRGGDETERLLLSDRCKALALVLA